MGILLTPNGWLLANGRPLSAVPGVAASTTSLTLTPYYVDSTLARPVWSRKAGTDSDTDAGYGDVPILYTFTGSAPVVEARITDKFRNVVVKDWTEVVNPQIDGTGQVVGTLQNVPSGMDYNTEIRVKGQPTVASSSTQKWGVGPSILINGQSNTVSWLGSDAYNATVPGSTLGENSYWNDPKFTGTFFGPDGFGVPYTVPGVGSSAGQFDNYGNGATDAAGGIAFLRIVGAALSAKYGRKIPVCATIWAWNGTSLDRMTPGGDSAFVYTNSGTTHGNIGWKSPKGLTPGDFELIIMHQGEAESGLPGLSRADRVTEQKTYYTEMLKLVAPAGRTAANLSFIAPVLGVYLQCPTIENIRGAAYDLAAAAPGLGWPKVRMGLNCIDIDTVDGYAADDTSGNRGIHFLNVPGGNQYRKWVSRRAMQDALKELRCATFGGAGPKITTTQVANVGNVATLTVAHEGGNTLAARSSGSALTGWYANTAADFSGTNIAVTATIANATTINVAFPGGTTYPAYLKYMGNKVGTDLSQHPDVSNPVYDNAVYPTGATGSDVFTGLPLQPTPDAIKVT